MGSAARDLTPSQIGYQVDVMRRRGVRWRHICLHFGRDATTLRKYRDAALPEGTCVWPDHHQERSDQPCGSSISNRGG